MTTLKRYAPLRKFPWFEVLLVVVLAGISIHAALSDAHNFPNKWFTRDDAYYYFKVAQNISEGYGSTFDGINPTNGYHPLWMLVCIPVFAFARFDLILPLRILLVLLGLLRAGTSVLLFRMLKGSLSTPIAMLAALYWAFAGTIHGTVYQQGLETGMAAFSLVLLLYLLKQAEGSNPDSELPFSRLVVLGVGATLLVFSRLDLVFLAIIMGIWIVFRRTPLRYALLIDLLVIVISLTGALLFRIGLPEYYHYEQFTLVALGASLLVKIPTFYFLGLYTRYREMRLPALVARCALAVLIPAMLLFGLLYLITSTGLLAGNFPRSVPIVDAGITYFLLLCSRAVLRKLSQTHTRPFHLATLAEWRANLRTWLVSSAGYFGVFGGSLAGYMLWNRLAFGSFTPVSGQVKNWWGSFQSNVYGGSARTALAFFGIDPEGDFNAWAPFTNQIGAWNSSIEMRTIPIAYDLRYTIMLLSIVLLVAIILVLMNRRRSIRLAQQLYLLPLLVGAQIQVLSYNLTGYAGLKEWYWIAQLIILVLAGGVVADIISQPLRRYRVGYYILLLLVLFWGLDTAASSARATSRLMYADRGSRDEPLMEAAAFIERYTEPGSLVGMTGGGNVGYFIQDRTIINMDGLINSIPYFLAHKAGRGSDFLAAEGMEYIFANPEFLEAQPYRGQYSGRLEVIDTYGGKAIMRFFALPQPALDDR